MKTPLFKSLSDDALRTEYRGYRALAYNQIAIGGGPRGARQMGQLMRAIQIIEGIARQRRIALVVAR